MSLWTLSYTIERTCIYIRSCDISFFSCNLLVAVSPCYTHLNFNGTICLLMKDVGYCWEKHMYIISIGIIISPFNMLSNRKNNNLQRYLWVDSCMVKDFWVLTGFDIEAQKAQTLLCNGSSLELGYIDAFYNYQPLPKVDKEIRMICIDQK
jgi:hypothetical protein